MVKKSKKNDNKVLYAGIVIAIIAILSLLVYTQTDIFSTSDTVNFTQMDYEYGIYPELQEYYSYDQIYDYPEYQHINGHISGSPPYYLSQSFHSQENNLAGFGLVLGKEIPNPTQLNVYLALWLADPGELVYIADGVIQGSLLPDIDTPYWIYCDINPTINVIPGNEYYIVLTTNQPYYRWYWYNSGNPQYSGGESWYYNDGVWHFDQFMPDFFFFTNFYAGYCENPFGYDEEVKECGDPDYDQDSTHEYRCEGDTGEWEDQGSTCDTTTPCPACGSSYEMSLWWIWLLIIALILISVYSYIRKKK